MAMVSSSGGRQTRLLLVNAYLCLTPSEGNWPRPLSLPVVDSSICFWYEMVIVGGVSLLSDASHPSRLLFIPSQRLELGECSAFCEE
jgi:hypothetical protein